MLLNVLSSRDLFEVGLRKLALNLRGVGLRFLILVNRVLLLDFLIVDHVLPPDPSATPRLRVHRSNARFSFLLPISETASKRRQEADKFMEIFEDPRGRAEQH